MNDEIKIVREMIAALMETAKESLEERRLQMDQFAATMHLSNGCSIEETDAGGVPAEWVKAPGVLEDRVILYLHGGGYIFGSPVSHRQMIGYVSRAATAKVLSLAYRLAPEHPCPAAVQDTAASYRWLLKQGYTPGRIAIAGDSAGGGLTVATLVYLRDSGVPLPAVGICISPWVDLSCSSETYVTRAEADPMIKQDQIRETAGMYLAGQDPKTPLASPLFADLMGLPPLLIQVGSDEVLLGDATGLDKKAKACGVDSTLEVWNDMIHVWHSFSPILKEGRDAIDRIGDYFKSHIK